MSQETATRPEQIKNALIKYILRHKLLPGDQLPAEAEMSKMLNVSRNTLREAYINLMSAGVINRRHGIGTFVARVPLVEDSSESGFVNFPTRIRAAGYTPHFRRINFTRREAQPEVYEALELKDTPALLFVERVILADSTPAVYLYDYLSTIFDQTDCDWNTFEGDMIGFLTEHFNLKLGHIHSRYRAVIPDGKIASFLQLSAGTPVITCRSIVYTLEKQPVIFTDIHFNPEIFELDAVRIINRSDLL